MVKILTKSAKETKKAARLLAGEIVRARPDRVGTRGAVVLALSGDLGAGKTTFAQGFAAALGVKEKVKSPTFVLMKIYELKQEAGIKKQGFRHFVHVDCYRVQYPKDLLHLGMRNLLKDHDAIVLIEWAERVKKILPRDTIKIRFEHTQKATERTITVVAEIF